MNSKVAASSTVVQALTCLASALPGISDSEDNMEDPLDGSGRGSGRGGREGAREVSSALASAGPQGDGTGGGSGGGVATGCVVKTEASSHRGGLEPSAVKHEEGESAAAVARAVASATQQQQQQQPPMRRRSRAITDVVTNFSIDRALEQLKSDEGKEDDEGEDGEAAALTRKGNRQRASVYVLMHAIAAVDTANDESWDGDEEPLEGVEEATSAI